MKDAPHDSQKTGRAITDAKEQPEKEVESARKKPEDTSSADRLNKPLSSQGALSPKKKDAFSRATNEDDDGYDPWSDRVISDPLWEEDPWS